MIKNFKSKEKQYIRITKKYQYGTVILASEYFYVCSRVDSKFDMNSFMMFGEVKMADIGGRVLDSV